MLSQVNKGRGLTHACSRRDDGLAGFASPHVHSLMDAKKTASVMQILKADVLYFAFVFGAGFVLDLFASRGSSHVSVPGQTN